MEDSKEKSVFATNIIQRREEKSWTQEELAHQAGVHVNTIKRIETDKIQGRTRTRNKIAKALGCTEDDLNQLPNPTESGARMLELMRILQREYDEVKKENEGLKAQLDLIRHDKTHEKYRRIKPTEIAHAAKLSNLITEAENELKDVQSTLTPSDTTKRK